MNEQTHQHCNSCGVRHPETPAPCPVCGAHRLRQDGGSRGLQVSDGLRLGDDEIENPTGAEYAALVLCLHCGLRGPSEPTCPQAIHQWNENAHRIQMAIYRARLDEIQNTREAIAA